MPSKLEKEILQHLRASSGKASYYSIREKVANSTKLDTTLKGMMDKGMIKSGERAWGGGQPAVLMTEKGSEFLKNLPAPRPSQVKPKKAKKPDLFVEWLHSGGSMPFRQFKKSRNNSAIVRKGWAKRKRTK